MNEKIVVVIQDGKGYRVNNKTYTLKQGLIDFGKEWAQAGKSAMRTTNEACGELVGSRKGRR